MVTGSHLSIITLNVNGLNAPTKDKDWLNGYKNKTSIYVVYKTRVPNLIQTVCEGLEKDIPYRWKSKESVSHSVMPDSLRPHGPQLTRFLCP